MIRIKSLGSGYKSIKLTRITTGAEFVYECPEIIVDISEQEKAGIKKYCSHPDLTQFVIKTKDGDFKIISDWHSGYMEVRDMKPPIESVKVKQFVVCGEVSFKPAWLIDQELCEKYNIPVLFEHQFTWVSDGRLFICRQQNISELTV